MSNNIRAAPSNLLVAPSYRRGVPCRHPAAQESSASSDFRHRLNPPRIGRATAAIPKAIISLTLAQINRANVTQLQVAWTFDTAEPGGLQTNPLIVNGVLYGITPTQKIFALDAATGKLLWKFDSGIKGTQPDRGLAYWSSGTSLPASSSA